MTFKEIQELIKLVNKMNLSEFKLKDDTFEIAIRTKDYSKNKMIRADAPQVISVPQQAMAPMPVQVATAPVAPAEAAPSNTASAEPSAGLIEVRSPIVGTFYRSQSPDKPPYVKVGDTIQAGDVVCIVEAMKLFNEIESEVSGKVVKVMTEEASPVEYDQVLFLVEPA
ncbi:acetyl-CoA carboxylase biotin carboxyl carrier protein [Saprospiraceae bacterium]|nr:acetyl-CoA carboxylase biotin carboxyl carrier protein [Saprospiraceae bacterium]